MSPKGSPHGEEERLVLEEVEMQKRSSVPRSTSTQQAAQSLFNTYFSRRFMSGCAILFPVVVTAYLTWWFLEFFDNFFSPLYTYLFGFHVFGLGFLTSMLFIFATGVFTSSWMGATLFKLSDYIIRKVPLVKHIYSAAKQVSAAVSPDNEATHSFRECVLIRHPRHGEYAFGFITGQTKMTTPEGELELFSVYVPTNHVYVGDIFLLAAPDIIRHNLSVREGIEVVVSVGMALPGHLQATGR
ncbi:COV1 [Auxenochlorella protothecoides x Auxenochlorella symbiontica]